MPRFQQENGDIKLFKRISIAGWNVSTDVLCLSIAVVVLALIIILYVIYRIIRWYLSRSTGHKSGSKRPSSKFLSGFLMVDKPLTYHQERGRVLLLSPSNLKRESLEPINTPDTPTTPLLFHSKLRKAKESPERVKFEKLNLEIPQPLPVYQRRESSTSEISHVTSHLNAYPSAPSKPLSSPDLSSSRVSEYIKSSSPMDASPLPPRGSSLLNPRFSANMSHSVSFPSPKYTAPSSPQKQSESRDSAASTSRIDSSTIKSPSRRMRIVATFVPALSDEVRISIGDRVEMFDEYSDNWCFIKRIKEDGTCYQEEENSGVVPRFCLTEDASPSLTQQTGKPSLEVPTSSFLRPPPALLKNNQRSLQPAPAAKQAYRKPVDAIPISTSWSTIFASNSGHLPRTAFTQPQTSGSSPLLRVPSKEQLSRNRFSQRGTFSVPTTPLLSQQAHKIRPPATSKAVQSLPNSPSPSVPSTMTPNGSKVSRFPDPPPRISIEDYDSGQLIFPVTK